MSKFDLQVEQYKQLKDHINFWESLFVDGVEKSASDTQMLVELNKKLEEVKGSFKHEN